MRSVVALAVATGLLAGCAPLSAPTAPTSGTSSTTVSRVARAQTTHQYTSAPAPTQHTTHPALSPLQAIRAFATAYINWNAGTVAADLRLLAAASIGQARSAMALAAARVGQDYELRRGGIANAGTVEAIAPLAASRDRFVVVTREQTSATATAAYQGLGPAWHVTLATVTRAGPGLWVVSGWQPET